MSRPVSVPADVKFHRWLEEQQKKAKRRGLNVSKTDITRMIATQRPTLIIPNLTKPLFRKNVKKK